MNCRVCGAPTFRPAPPLCPVCQTPTQSDGPRGITTSLRPGEAISAIVAALTAQGSQVGTRTEASATGTLRQQRRPNIAVAVILFLLCVVPAIIYIIMESKADVTVWSIDVVPEDGGSRVVPVVRGTLEGARTVYAALRTLP